MRPRVSRVWGGERVQLSGGMSCVGVRRLYALSCGKTDAFWQSKSTSKFAAAPRNLLIKICGGPDRKTCALANRRPEQPPRVAARPLELAAFLLDCIHFLHDTEFYNTKTRKNKRRAHGSRTRCSLGVGHYNHRPFPKQIYNSLPPALLVLHKYRKYSKFI